MSSPLGEHPTEIGPYRVLDVLGRGGAGAVYRCRGPRGEVAVKLPQLYDTEDVLRFQRECRLQQELGGDGLLPLLEVGQCAQGPYAVLPMVEGGTLQDRLRLGPLPWREAVELVGRVAEVVGRMHSVGVVHRDLKPANVLIAGDGRPWVADLGLSKHSDRDADSKSVSFSQTGVFSGTPGFMAPEQAEDAKSVGPSADVFALGAILYTTLVGTPPFEGRNAADVVRQSASGTYVPIRSLLPEVPTYLGHAIEAALAIEPEDRPPTGGAFLASLQPPTISTVDGAGAPRWLPLALGGVLGFAALTAVLGVSLVLRRQAPSPPVTPPPTVAEADTEPPANEDPVADPAPADPPPTDPVEPDTPPLPAGVKVLLEAPGAHLGLVREVAVDLTRGRVVTGTINGEVRLFDASTGAELASWFDPRWGMVDGVGFAPDGTAYGVTKSGELLRVQVEGVLGARASGHPTCWELAIGTDGTLLSCGPDGLRSWTPEQLQGDGPPPELLISGPVHKVRCTPDGTALAIGKEGVWRWKPGAEPLRVEGGPPPEPYEDLCVSPDGRYVATLTRKNVVRLYSWPALELLAERQVFHPHPSAPAYLNTRGLCFTAASDRLLSGGADPEIRAWSLPELEPSDGGWNPRWPAWTECIRLGPNGTLLAAGNAGQLIAFSPQGTPRWKHRARPFHFLVPGPHGPHHESTVAGLAWLDDEATQLLLNGERGLELLDVATAQRSFQGFPNALPGGRRILTGGGRVFCDFQGKLHWATPQLEGDRLQLAARGTLRLEPHQHICDLTFYEGRLYVLGAFGADPTQTVLRAVNLEDPASSLSSQPLELGGEHANFGDSLPGANTLLVYGERFVISLRTEHGQLLWGPDEEVARVEITQPLRYAAALTEQRWLLSHVDGHTSALDLEAGEQASFRLEGARSIHAWADGVAANFGNRIEVISTDTGQPKFRLELDDMALCMLASPSGDALYVWTALGKLVRFPLRPQ